MNTITGAVAGCGKFKGLEDRRFRVCDLICTVIQKGEKNLEFSQFRIESKNRTYLVFFLTAAYGQMFQNN